ncbi:MAG: NAD(P)H-binding protein [Chloroflexi bacterium]|nr:NAD(P)H-binding protein [Chloroflexota bacterium]
MNAELHVVFGSGPVGLAVVDELARRHHRVRLVNRSGRANVPAGVEVAAGNAADPASTRDLCRGAAVVYNCLNAPDYHKWPEQFPPLQAGVLEGAASGGARLVVMENLYMYGPHGGKPMTEDMTMNATRGTRGPTRARMTQDLFDAHRSGKVRVVSARASDFFGPRVHESSAGDRMFVPLLAGKTVQMMGDPDVPHSYTYMPDIGRALVMLGECDEAFGQAWHIPSAETVTPRRFVTMIAEEAGVEPKIAALKKSPLRAVMLPLMGLFVPPLRGYDEVLYQFDEPFIVDAAKFERLFGRIATPLRDAIRETVAWHRQNGAR